MSTEWLPIETAPRDSERKMIVVKAINADAKVGALYTSDPYCVWWNSYRNQWARWPHNSFQPTHWLPLPA